MKEGEASMPDRNANQTKSCIYEGRVVHRRAHPVRHAFSVPLYMMYLDLDELPALFRGRWLWSARRPALARFRREDYLGDPAEPLDRAVRRIVQARSGHWPSGPIRLLTQLRHFGLGFNPVSFYYCFAEDGEALEAVVAEVTNTPWKERHCYVLTPERHPREDRREDRRRAGIVAACDKDFHVSPFMGMEMQYRWALGTPGETLALAIENRVEGEGRLFDASLQLRRVEIDGPALARVLLRYPAMSAQVVAGIYWQALRLFLKRAPFHPHPRSVEAALEIAP